MDKRTRSSNASLEIAPVVAESHHESMQEAADTNPWRWLSIGALEGLSAPGRSALRCPPGTRQGRGRMIRRPLAGLGVAHRPQQAGAPAAALGVGLRRPASTASGRPAVVQCAAVPVPPTGAPLPSQFRHGQHAGTKGAHEACPGARVTGSTPRATTLTGEDRGGWLTWWPPAAGCSARATTRHGPTAGGSGSIA